MPSCASLDRWPHGSRSIRPRRASGWSGSRCSSWRRWRRWPSWSRRSWPDGVTDRSRPLGDPGAALSLDGFVDRVPGWIRSTLGYCSRCGAPLELGLVPGEHRERLVCGACGFIAYVNPRLVVSTLPVTEDGELVLLRRAIEPAYGTWAQPGGFLEADETAIQGAVRETLEETGLEVVPTSIVGLYSQPHSAVVVVAYEATIVGGEAR